MYFSSRAISMNGMRTDQTVTPFEASHQHASRKDHLRFTICRRIRLLSCAENSPTDLIRCPPAAGRPPARQDGSHVGSVHRAAQPVQLRVTLERPCAATPA